VRRVIRLFPGEASHVEGKRREARGEKEPSGKLYSELQSEKGEPLP
jgi:hypothetical protein